MDALGEGDGSTLASGLGGSSHLSVQPILPDEKAEQYHSTNEKRQTTRSSFFGWRTQRPSPETDAEAATPAARPTRLFAPIYNGIGSGLAFILTFDLVRKLLVSYWLDGNKTRFVLVIVIPLLFCVSLVSPRFTQ
jgi:hypothetical protein